VREELEAPGMHARQHRHRVAGISVRYEPYGALEAKVELAMCHSVDRYLR
jgi:hypothetical protein